MKKTVILASQSPRRMEILQSVGINFEIIPSFDDEIIPQNTPPHSVATLLAKNKALSVFNQQKKLNQDILVVGADTIVVVDNEILGKPKDINMAKSMLEKLSNRKHQVITGFSLITKDFSISEFDITEVTFNDLSSEQIQNYLDSGLYIGKAGSYGIQDGFDLVKSYDGSFLNVMGLPIERIEKIIKEWQNE